VGVLIYEKICGCMGVRIDQFIVKYTEKTFKP
jgi:hypothetical protein